MSALRDARQAQEALEMFAGQVEDEQRSGDLGTLLAADAIALALIAIAEEIGGIGAVYGDRNP